MNAMIRWNGLLLEYSTSTRLVTPYNSCTLQIRDALVARTPSFNIKSVTEAKSLLVHTHTGAMIFRFFIKYIILHILNL